MSKLVTSEVMPEPLAEHPAAKAWRQVQSAPFEPEHIEVLKKKRKSAVYRLNRNGAAVIAKRCRTATAVVERMIYDEILARLPIPALRCYGFLPESNSEFTWLFLEDAGGQMYSPDSAEHRALAGRWLGTLHSAAVSAELSALLPDRSLAHYLQLLRSTRQGLHQQIGNPILPVEDVALLRTVVAQCDAMEAHWNELETYWEAWPRALVHDDFAMKNLRVRSAGNGPALLVFDWEMAGWGTPAAEFAQLGKTVSPDLNAYCSILRQNCPQLEIGDVQRLADYGNILRLVNKVFWEMISMQGDSYEYLVLPLSIIRRFEPDLTAALRALNWRW